MKTRKIKLAYPTYRSNRLKRTIRTGLVADNIAHLIQIQNDKANNYDPYNGMASPEALNPGPWTLHFDGKDFYFEGTEENILYSGMWEEEAK